MQIVNAFQEFDSYGYVHNYTNRSSMENLMWWSLYFPNKQLVFMMNFSTAQKYTICSLFQARTTRKKYQKSAKILYRMYLPMDRIPLTCLTLLNSPTIVFSASLSCSSFIGAVLPPTTAATCATKPLSTWKRQHKHYIVK